MEYYIDQKYDQERQKRLAELLAMQQDNNEPGVQFDTQQQSIPQQGSLSDLMKSGASRDQINELLSQSTMTTSGFNRTPMGGEPQMPRAPGYGRAGVVEQAPLNMIRNNSTGRTFAPEDQYGQPSQSQLGGPAPDYSMPIEYGGMGKGYRLKGDATRAVMADGRIIDMGRDTGAERTRMKEDLGIQKQRVELAQMQAKPTSELDKARAKMIAEAEGAQLSAKIPGTIEYERVEKREGAQNKEQSAWSSSIKQADTMDDNIDKILGEGKYKSQGSKLGFFATGLPGQVLENFGGTSARDLSGDLSRIKANIGFDELNKMRRESPTGGALGNITERELEFLQSVQGSLDQAQSPEQIERMLWDVKMSTQRLKQDLKDNPPKGFSGNAAPAKSGAEQQAMLMQEAQAAIASGAPRDAVMKRLQEKMGL